MCSSVNMCNRIQSNHHVTLNHDTFQVLSSSFHNLTILLPFLLVTVFVLISMKKVLMSHSFKKDAKK